MDTEKAKKLINKYYSGETSRKEEQQLRAYFRRDTIPDELKPHADQFRYYDHRKQSDAPEIDLLGKINFEEEASKPSFAMPYESLREGGEGGQDSAESELKEMAEKSGKSDDEKTNLAAAESINSRVMFDPFGDTSKPGRIWTLRIAAGFILLLIGFAAGQFLGNNDDEYASTQQVAALEEEVQQMKQALMNGGSFENASAGERLSAINASTRFSGGEQQADSQIRDILIYTLNNDQNINVRAAAAEALFQFRDDTRIKKALVNSLNQQDDPLIQITLIDMLVELKAKSAINEMERMLVDTGTREVVRERLKTGIARLKA